VANTRKINKEENTTLTLALAALTVSSTVAAKTLVYCSEGSPENFKTGTALASTLVPEVYNWGLKFSGDPSEQYTSVFAEN
jgi:dipeptide transport system substrate-binding protein